MIKGDLHMHSVYSDGLFTPERLIELAAGAGCRAVALTDHDCVAGVNEMSAAAVANGLVNITGIELSSFDGQEVHILGYNVDLGDAGFIKLCDGLCLRREERARAVLAVLRSRGVDVPFELVQKKARGSLSRAHITRVMIDLGYEKDFGAAYKKWFAQGAPAYVPIRDLTPEKAIAAVKAAGGIAALAHPARLKMDAAERASFIGKLAGAGLDGLEVYYRDSAESDIADLAAAAKRFNLISTCGNDFHGFYADTGNKIVAKELPGETPRALKIGA